VGRGRDDVGVRQWVGVQASCDESGEVGHVDHEERANGVGDASEGRKVLLPGVRRPARDDQARPVLDREVLDLPHVNPPVVTDVARPCRAVR